MGPFSFNHYPEGVVTTPVVNIVRTTPDGKFSSTPADSLGDVFGRAPGAAAAPTGGGPTAHLGVEPTAAPTAPAYRPTPPPQTRVWFDLGPEVGWQQAAYDKVYVSQYGPYQPTLVCAFRETGTGYLPPLKLPGRPPMAVRVEGHEQSYSVHNLGVVVTHDGSVLVILFFPSSAAG